MYCLKHDAQSGYVEVGCDTPDALVVVTRMELAQYSPVYLDIESAKQIGLALLLVMSVAVVIRMAIKSLSQRNEE
ncbi:hypothetical protein [Xylophilus ampelinus]|uniref:Uncharacterized protein n=1 Tax=Xylophilus ampelinus TaxID=54067 RepID=A0A318SPY1_9BURK|nr:hypothetical protein [Xylophilus ampelinus]MCS4508779.1 hypothetical protein [Xylophilus ampelinus]PYE79349.1 hypothetical protein DFQ15_10280 [Xylophilus ampelinus]